MNKFFGKLTAGLRHVAVAFLTVAFGIFALAVGLALLGLRVPAEHYAEVGTEVSVLFVCVFGLLAVTSLAAAAVRRVASSGDRPRLMPE
jgi:hypothetical protein